MEQSRWFTRWGNFVAGPKTKYITLLLWVVAAVVLSIVAPSVNRVEDNNAALLPANAPSVQAAAKVKVTFPNAAGIPALVVWYRNSGLTTQDLQNVQAVAKSLSSQPLPAQTSVVPLQQLPFQALSAMESSDKTTIVLPVTFSESAASTTLQTSLSGLQTRATQVLGSNPFHDTSMQTDGLHARITGPAGIAMDALGLFKNADFALLAATTMLVLILLMLLYRSPVLAFVPLIGVGIAYSVIGPLLGLLAKSGLIVVDAQGISIMTVLLFGAGTDYCLFLVARYRERLFMTQDKHIAMRDAVGGSAGAIAMSGLTVVLSLITLLFAHYGSNHRFAIPFSLAVLVMAFAGITLVPAILAILGRASFFPFVPRTEQMWAARAAKRNGKRTRARKTGAPGRISQTVGRVVSRHPWPVAIVSVVALATLASFSLQIKTTYNILSSFPQDMPSRQGFTVLAKHFSAGALAPVQILLDTDTGLAQVESELQSRPYVQTVVAQKSTASAHLLLVTLKGDPDSNTAMSDIPLLQRAVTDTLAGAGVSAPSAHVWIAGETATQHDTQVRTARDTRIVIPLVIAVIAVLLLIYLRAIVATVYLILTVLLSYFSALGTGWLVVHNLMGDTAIQGAIPLYAFVFLVALGEDYNIFMVSRIWQARRTMPLRAAIAEGVSRTSSVITSAGLILAGTFAVLASLPIQVLVQFGLVTAIGILLDTFIVRPFLVPAITAILGKVAFWPSTIGYDAHDSTGIDGQQRALKTD